MANTVRIIPNSGSLTFATGIANPSASIAGASTFKFQIDGSGVLALNTASVDLATFSPTNLSLDNDATALIIPSASAQPPGAAIGTLYINTNNNLLEAVGNGGAVVNIVGDKGQKGNTGAQGPNWS